MTNSVAAGVVENASAAEERRASVPRGGVPIGREGDGVG